MGDVYVEGGCRGKLSQTIYPEARVKTTMILNFRRY
ncbi:MAG: hypothetical protein ACI82Z_001781 [Cellvibrionaceae bacterium]|jgi:hypothetical protein